MGPFKRLSVLLWANVLSAVDEDVYYGRIVPKHGPGATADKLAGNRKFVQTEWTKRLEEVFPCGEHLIPSWRHHQCLDRVQLLDPGQERPVKVTPVPKTLKTPRIIAIEPTCMQYMQQGVAESITTHLNNDPVMREMVNFVDQTRNHRHCMIGSSDGSYATLDLSEASDRVSNQLVRAMVSHVPHLSEALDATRSRKADVPGRGVIRLAKYASMGSALCFPIEAMVFTTIIFVGIERALDRQLTRSDIRRLSRDVRVYGDDIIVPVEFVDYVITALEDFGLLVNRDKSFWTGKFRESCGKEYYDGHDVSIVRVRRMLPTSRKHSQELVSTASLRNQLYMAGLWTTCGHLDDYIRGIIRFPTVGPNSRVVGRWSILYYEVDRVCPHLQIPLVRGLVDVSKPPVSKLDGEEALLKFFLKRGSEVPEIGHLDRAGRPRSVDIRSRWASSM